MIHIIDLSHKVEEYLKEKRYSQFKIFIRLNFNLDVYIVSDEKITDDSAKENFLEWLVKNSPKTRWGYSFYEIEKDHIKLTFHVISSVDSNDEFYYGIFNGEKENSISTGPRYRLNSILKEESYEEDIKTKVPLITFYSYKGGVGRTTTLMAYALDLAFNKNKKVVVLDCDFEAPGYINFFNLSLKKDLIYNQKNGLVELLSDMKMLDKSGQSLIDVRNYMVGLERADLDQNYNASIVSFEELNARKNIWVMPAGNLNLNILAQSDENALTNLYDYLEGLSKLNLSNVKDTVSYFNRVIAMIKEQINPDVILLDSRTGFNDIFGTAAFYLSKCVVGFFGFSQQSVPGFVNLVNRYFTSKKDFKLFIVNSILPNDEDSTSNDEYNSKKLLSLIRFLNKNHKEMPTFHMIHRKKELEQIGVNDKRFQDSLFKLMREQPLEEYHNLFKDISQTIF